MGCLQKRVGELKALVEIFTRADAVVVQKAIQASTSLSSIGICADEEALRAPYPPPKSKEAKAKVEAIRESLAKVRAHEKTGKYKEGMQLARKLEKEANNVGYLPVQAEILYWIGLLFEKAGEYQQAETILHDAIDAAGEIRDALLAAREMTLLVWVVGYRQARYKEGLLLGRNARTMLKIAGGDERTEAWLLNSLGGLSLRKGEYSKALEHYRNSLEKFEKVLGPENPIVGQLLNNLGVVYVDSGEFDTANLYYRKALKVRETTLGPEHPEVAMTLNNLGALFGRQGAYDKAIGYLEKSLEIKEKALGAEHPTVAYALDGIGEILFRQGEYNRSLNAFRKSLTILEKALGPDHPILAWPLDGIGNVFVHQGRPDLAFKPLERAISICQQKTCDLGPQGRSIYNFARTLVSTGGNKKRAIKMVRKARTMFEKTAKKFKKELEEVDAWLKKHDKG